MSKPSCLLWISNNNFETIYIRGQFTVTVIVLSYFRLEVVLFSMSIHLKHKKFLYYIHYTSSPTFDPIEVAACQLELTVTMKHEKSASVYHP